MICLAIETKKRRNNDQISYVVGCRNCELIQKKEENKETKNKKTNIY